MVDKISKIYNIACYYFRIRMYIVRVFQSPRLNGQMRSQFRSVLTEKKNPKKNEEKEKQEEDTTCYYYYHSLGTTAQYFEARLERKGEKRIISLIL